MRCSAGTATRLTGSGLISRYRFTNEATSAVALSGHKNDRTLSGEGTFGSVGGPGRSSSRNDNGLITAFINLIVNPAV